MLLLVETMNWNTLKISKLPLQATNLNATITISLTKKKLDRKNFNGERDFGKSLEW